MPLQQQCLMRCLKQQSYGFFSLPQPIKWHEALKNGIESGGVGGCEKPRLELVRVVKNIAYTDC